MKSIVITGSTRGIGFALADAFLGLGCQVTISGRAQASVDKAVADLVSRHAEAGRVAGFPCNVTHLEELQALWDAARRIDITEFNFFVISMAVQRETGGNLAETLENLDSILRRRRQMKLKVKAMSSEARASAAIIGSLPFVMFGLLFVIGRSYVGTLLTTSTGHMLLAVGGVSMLLGFVVIARMVRFEI